MKVRCGLTFGLDGRRVFDWLPRLTLRAPAPKRGQAFRWSISDFYRASVRWLGFGVYIR